MKSRRRFMRTKGDVAFDIFNSVVICIIVFIVFYPLYIIVISSLSDPGAVTRGEVLLRPVGVSLEGYNKVIHYPDIWIGYRNSIIYTLFGSLLSVASTVCCGFALGRKTLPFRKILITIFIIPMFFNGGMIPTFLTIQRLNLINQPVLLILLGCINIYNIIIAKSFISSTVPEELYEASYIDGCGDLRYLVTVIIPLSKALIAVMFVFTISYYWNSYFNALIYITDDGYKPLSLIIRRILIDTNWSMNESMDLGQIGTDAAKAQQMMLSVKYCVFIVSSLPLMLVYPFAQKSFVKGVMIGSLKG